MVDKNEDKTVDGLTVAKLQAAASRIRHAPDETFFDESGNPLSRDMVIALIVAGFATDAFDVAEIPETHPAAATHSAQTVLFELLADIATVIATLPQPADPAARKAHTRLSLLADARAAALRKEADERAAQESRERSEATQRQLAEEGKAALRAR